MVGSDYDEGRLGFEFQLLELSRLNVKFYQTLNFLPIAFNNIIIVVVAANIHNPGYGDFFGTLLSSSSSSPSTYTTRIVEKEKRPWSINYWRSFYTAAPVTWLPSIYYLWTTPWRRIYRETIPLHCENHIVVKTDFFWLKLRDPNLETGEEFWNPFVSKVVFISSCSSVWFSRPLSLCPRSMNCHWVCFICSPGHHNNGQ